MEVMRERLVRYGLIALLAAGIAGRGQAQIPYQVQNLGSSGVQTARAWTGAFALGDRAFLGGAQLWLTDGTALGTRPLAEVDSCFDRPFLGAIHGVLLECSGPFPLGGFLRQGGLWRSDGTPRGTYPLSGPDGEPVEFNPFHADHPYALAEDRLYFLGAAVGDSHHVQVWQTDGTSGGTLPITVPALAGQAPEQLAVAGNRLYLVLGSPQTALWTSDGTPQGTVELHRFDRGVGPLAALGSELIFVAGDQHPQEIWVSDGTVAGTRAVAGFARADALVDTAFLKPAGGHAFFVADEGAFGLQLWVTDGTAAGTRRLTSFTGVDPFGSDQGLRDRTLAPDQLEEVNGRAIFIAHASGATGFQVWSTAVSPDANGPGQVALCEAGCIYHYQSLLKAGQRVFFARADNPGFSSTDGTPGGTLALPAHCKFCSVRSLLHAERDAVFFNVEQVDESRHTELWRSDGTAAGTGQFASTPWDGAALVTVGGRVVYTASGDNRSQPGLWVGDGTADGNRQLAGQPFEVGLRLDNFVAQGDRLVFTDLQATGQILWRTDGTPGQAIQLGGPNAFTPLAGTDATTYLHAINSDELWKTEAATPVPTRLGVLPGLGKLSPSGAEMAIFDGQLYAAVQDQTVWKSDGTPAGTGPAFVLPPGYVGASELTPLGTDLYFIGLMNPGPPPGEDVLKSDGTSQGTIPLTHFGAASREFCKAQFTRVGANVFFVGWDVASGHEVWKTDGTPGGTALVADLAPGGYSSWPTDLTEHQGSLFFFATTRSRGLWRSDGTAQGTIQVAELPDSGSSDPCGATTSLVSTGSLLFFVRDDGIHGRELWQSDGTAAGTALAKDIQPGPFGSNPSDLLAVAGQLFFTADDGVHGRELWRSDGTDAGTRMVADLAPGPDSSDPQNLTVAGNRLFFAADDGVTGRQLWALPLAGPGCQPAATVLCLQGGRFAVSVEWLDFTGHFGLGQAVPLTADTGYFWFFGPANVEVIVKVLDGRALNGNFWVFYGALSSVSYAITVTDSVTGLARRYQNFPGNLASVADTSAFSGSGTSSGGVSPPAGLVRSSRLQPPQAGAAAESPKLPPAHVANRKGIAGAARSNAAGSCAADALHLCLNGSRFAVEASWTDFSGHSGHGTAVGLTGDTGYFWFFSPSNVEVVLKVLDGRAVNGKFWVFFGALSNVEYDLKVTDTVTGVVKLYHNPPGQLASVADISAF
jgi:ELWxxDGT repeat protein